MVRSRTLSPPACAILAIMADSGGRWHHGYELCRQGRVKSGTLYPLLLRLEQEGAIASERGPSENNRSARFYRLTSVGRKQLQSETRDWERTAALIDRFFAVKAQDLK